MAPWWNGWVDCCDSCFLHYSLRAPRIGLNLSLSTTNAQGPAHPPDKTQPHLRQWAYAWIYLTRKHTQVVMHEHWRHLEWCGPPGPGLAYARRRCIPMGTPAGQLRFRHGPGSYRSPGPTARSAMRAHCAHSPRPHVHIYVPMPRFDCNQACAMPL